MRQIICLRADEGTAYQVTYRVGETPAGGSPGEFVEKIEITAHAQPPIIGATVYFADRMQREIPWHRIISWDLAPEEKT